MTLLELLRPTIDDPLSRPADDVPFRLTTHRRRLPVGLSRRVMTVVAALLGLTRSRHCSLWFQMEQRSSEQPTRHDLGRN